MSRDDLVTENGLGRVVLTAGALAAHVVEAAETVAGARVRRPRRGVDVDVGDGRVHVALRLAAASGSTLPALGEAIQVAIADAIGRTTGRRVTVDVAIEAIET